MATNDEVIDIYDADHRKTGRVEPRKGIFLKEGEFMMYVLAVIQNEEGKILITQRALDKKWAAGLWEVPGGGACAGEDSTAAVVREVFEETGLSIAGKTGEPIYSYENVDFERGDNYFVDIYHVNMAFNESDIRIREREALGFALVGWDDIVELSKSGKFLHYERLCQALGKSI